MRANANRTRTLYSTPMIVVAILLIATALRTYRLTDVPPGIEHDEVAEWQIARGILAGHHALFFRQAYGQEPLYLYLQAAAITMWGDHLWTLRFTTFAIAMLTLAACYRLTRRLFGRLAALASLALIAVTLWPIFFSRLGLRAMTLPLMVCLGADMWFSRLRYKSILAGVFFGLAAYTYLAVRALPLLLVGFGVYLVLFARRHMALSTLSTLSTTQRKWQDLAATSVWASLIALPLVVYLLIHPEIQFRVSEVSEPLDRLLRGDPAQVLQGVLNTALMFSVRGDQTVYYNWPGRPVFAEPLSATLFYIGLALAVWRWRKPEYAFVLLWLVTLLTPVIVTAGAPAFVRALGALPAIYAFPGIGVAALVDWTRQRCAGRHRHAQRLTGAALVLLVCFNIWLTARDYFTRWSSHPETQFVWQADLAAVARQLDSTQNGVALARIAHDVAVAGLANTSMDDASLHLLLKRRDLAIRWFDSRAALLIPSGESRMFIPRIVPLDPVLRERLAAWGAREHADPSGRFTWFEWPTTALRIAGLESVATTPAGDSIGLPVQFGVGPRGEHGGNTVMVLGYELLTRRLQPGQDVITLTYWRAQTLPLPPLKAFVHLTDPRSGDKLIAQSDGLDAPTEFWRSGDVIVQLHRFTVPANAGPGMYHLKLGVYNPETGARAQFLAADQPSGDHILLLDIEVER